MRKRSAQVTTPLLEAALRDTLTEAQARRLAERLRRYREYIFTFLNYGEVTADNHFGERQGRPAGILRKNSPSNRSARGAATQAVLMPACRQTGACTAR